MYFHYLPIIYAFNIKKRISDFLHDIFKTKHSSNHQGFTYAPQHLRILGLHSTNPLIELKPPKSKDLENMSMFT